MNKDQQDVKERREREEWMAKTVLKVLKEREETVEWRAKRDREEIMDSQEMMVLMASKEKPERRGIGEILDPAAPRDRPAKKESEAYRDRKVIGGRVVPRENVARKVKTEMTDLTVTPDLMEHKALPDWTEQREIAATEE